MTMFFYGEEDMRSLRGLEIFSQNNIRILRKGKKVRQDLRNRSETDRESPHVGLV